MNRLRGRRGVRHQVQIGASDPCLTPVAGMLAVTELVDRIGVVDALDEAVGPIKQRARGLTGGEFLVGLACAQLAGEDYLIGLDRRRADVAGGRLAPVPTAPSTTAATLAKRFDTDRWHRVEAALGHIAARVIGRLDKPRRDALLAAPTIDIDATDVEVYGSRKQGISYNYKGQRAGRPHLATWAEAGIVLAADLLAGDEDPRAGVVDLFTRALVGLSAATAPHGGHGRVRVRGDIGYFTKDLADAVVAAGADFAIGANRNPATWRAAAAVPEDAWSDADAMPGAQVAVADYTPGGWPEGTRCLIRRVRHEAAAISADPRARRRKTIPADQLALALDGDIEQVWAYSFIVTNLDVSTPERARAVECWYRHRTDIEDRIRDAKHGAALRHLPSGDRAVNTAWMWGALLATNLSAWLHELAGLDHGDGRGRAHLSRLRRELICVPGRLITHARRTVLRLPPGPSLLAQALARLRAIPA
ncbi:IS1380 family transposase [Nocardioides sp. YIM 152315]|nr:IS1380 family transposase [Nocardioides sp. YIM 152315]MDF1603865.1 IS1380 family transposase [Nocardioides sp. YIM 152315]